MTRAFFIECSGTHWLGIGRRLADRLSVVPVLWSGDAATITRAQQEFPGVLAVLGVDAACGRVLREMAANAAPLDAPSLRALAVDESIALSMMDRMDQIVGRFHHDSRRRHWYELLRIWSGALDALAPDVVIFSIAPHIVYDYALYALCKLRGIPTQMFERTALPGLVYVQNSFEDGSAALRDAVQKTSGATELSVRARRSLEGLRRGGATALPPNYRKKLAARRLLGGAGGQARVGLLRMLGSELTRAAYVLIRLRAAPANYFVREDRFGRLVSPGAWSWLAGRWRGQWKKQRLARLLGNLSRPVENTGPYVLLALHYQPERAIVPMAQVLGDQTLIVDLLARTLPPGWTLVVKEHPWQLVPFSWGELARDAGFYRRLADHPSVILAPPETETETLLRGAKAVATATGSIGWQALARGIPVLLFGAAWYRDAPGIHVICNVASCAEAMASVARGESPPSDAAERMLAAVEKVGVAGYLEPGLEDVDEMSEADVVASMSDALVRNLTGYGDTARAAS